MSILQPMARISPARRLQRFRAKATLLLAVFLSAGTSLPSLDALAYHQDSAEDGKARQHVEPAGGCLSHTDQCSLGRSAAGSGAIAALGDVSRMEPDSPPARRGIPQLQPTCADLSAVPQPRAPPTLRYV